jgi:hypothetical protein
MNQIPPRSSTSSSSNDTIVSRNNDDPCSNNSRYTIIYNDTKYNGIKPRNYCRIDKNTKKKYFCSQVGNNIYRHACKTLPTPYIEDKPKSFFSMFSSNKGGRKSYKLKNKKSSKKGNKKTRKTKKAYKI